VVSADVKSKTILKQNLRVNPYIVVANLSSYRDRLFEDERQIRPGNFFLELVKAGQD
jgi:hypothetical protein